MYKSLHLLHRKSKINLGNQSRTPRKTRSYSSSSAGSAINGSSEIDYDVVIVGGGLVGATMACSLGSIPLLKDLKICLIETSPKVLNPSIPSNLSFEDPNKTRAPDMRVVSINPTNAKFFEDIGVWQFLMKGDSLREFLDSQQNPAQIDATSTSSLPHSSSGSSPGSSSILRSSSIDGVSMPYDIVGGPTAFDSMKVWEGHFSGYVEFYSQEMGIPALGYLVENNSIQRSLFARIEQLQKTRGKIDVFCPEKVTLLDHPVHHRGNAQSKPTKIYNYQNSVVLQTQSGRKIKTGLLIAADGAESPIRKSCLIPTSGSSYNTMGVVTVLEHQNHNHTAFQKFLPFPEGIIAVLPMWRNYSSLVWSTSIPTAEALLKLDQNTFVDTLNNALRFNNEDHGIKYHEIGTIKNSAAEILNKIGISKLLPNSNDSFEKSMPPSDLPLITNVIGPRAAFPLQTKSAQNYVLPGVALIGDAGHVVHPLAGQGVNLGLQDVVSLTNAISHAVFTGQPCDSWMALESFEKERLGANQIMQFGIDAIEKIFRADDVLMTSARSLGFSTVNRLTPLKSVFANMAIGEPPSLYPQSTSVNPNKLKYL